MKFETCIVPLGIYLFRKFKYELIIHECCCMEHFSEVKLPENVENSSFVP